MTNVSERSLYERMGGYDTLAAFTDELLQRLTSDPEIGIYWRGHSTDSMKRDRQLIVDFLCEAIGGPVIYRRTDLKTSHQGLRISERDWEVFANHAVAALEKLEVPEQEKQEFLECAASLKDDIVEER
ncbi:MAG: group 1 truncated hemoglobin [Chloroflexi bacterium]|nr:group 1 truncated hemoglobin [Chloroflexota bacterium]